jgi:hypothetical protein
MRKINKMRQLNHTAATGKEQGHVRKRGMHPAVYLIPTAQSEVQILGNQLCRLVLPYVDKCLETFLEHIEEQIRTVEALAHNLVNSLFECQ